MDVREKLVELIVWIEDQMTRAYPYTTDQFRIETTVDYLIANGVTVQEQDGCEHCRAASYTENPFIVITQMGREVKTQFNFCPNCGRRLLQPPKEE